MFAMIRGGLHRTALALAVMAALLLPLGVLAAGGNEVPKYALLIGNAKYGGAQGALPNTLRDAALVAASLRKLGFVVTERNDLGREEMSGAVADFAARLPEGATAFVYYAGHGMQVGGGNYLVPADMVPASEQSVQMKAYPLKHLLERLATSRAAVNIVVLDACRNNPFQPQGGVRYRSFANLGLSPTVAPRGTLLAYSTAPGQLAEDGKGRNGPYATALARLLLEPQLELEQIFKRVSEEVRHKTLDEQIPWYESSIASRYYFLPPDGVSVVAGQAPAGQPASRGPQRGGAADPATNLPWFLQLQNSEWSRIDWEIQMRTRNATPDEIPALEHKAKGGSVVVQTVLGLLYRDGTEKATDMSSGKVTRFKANNTKALQWLKRAAEAGFPVAQTELGEMYYGARGVERDLGASRRWLEKAAKADYPRAKLDLLQLDLEQGLAGFGGRGLLSR